MGTDGSGGHGIRIEKFNSPQPGIALGDIFTLHWSTAGNVLRTFPALVHAFSLASDCDLNEKVVIQNIIQVCRVRRISRSRSRSRRGITTFTGSWLQLEYQRRPLPWDPPTDWDFMQMTTSDQAQALTTRHDHRQTHTRETKRIEFEFPAIDQNEAYDFRLSIPSSKATTLRS
ncbi:hypothetical protein CC2G_002896 [Coprinopsis cinerea AmutBmut pab1-1]|nr:hypothetical protein CC2G_002896 [Coprinopsis cinerea AmutBmut pab1-1]